MKELYGKTLPKDGLLEADKNTLCLYYEETKGRALSDTYKVGRDNSIVLAKKSKSIFDMIEEKGLGYYTVSGVKRKVTEYDYEALRMGVSQSLCNQSYQSGNKDENSGISRQEATELSKQSGKTYYTGHIVSTLKDLCRLCYGVEEPSKSQLMAIETLIDTLIYLDVEIPFPNGDKLNTPLLWRQKFTRKADGAKFLNIYLHPIFCSDVASNFAEFPQNLTKKLTEVTKKKKAAHYKLIQFLGIQDKRKPLRCNISTLLEALRLDETYKKNPTRTEKELLILFEDMKKLEILSSYEVERISAKRREAITKIEFRLNPDYIRKGDKEA